MIKIKQNVGGGHIVTRGVVYLFIDKLIDLLYGPAEQVGGKGLELGRQLSPVLCTVTNCRQFKKKVNVGSKYLVPRVLREGL